MTEPDRTFAALARRPGLKARDLPTLSAELEAALQSGPPTVRALVVGAVHPVDTVRKFVRKVLPRLAQGRPEAVASPLLSLAVESVLPFRPAGPGERSFDGLASPVGAQILSHRLELADRPIDAGADDPQGYNASERYGRACAENLVYLLERCDPASFVRLWEYASAHSRVWRYRPPPPPARWPHGTFSLANQIHQFGLQRILGTVRRHVAAIGDAWLETDLMLEQPARDPAQAALQARFRSEFDGPNRSNLGDHLFLTACTFVSARAFPERTALLAQARANVAKVAPGLRAFAESRLRVD